MKTYILKENVLSDDTLYLADENKFFKGGFVAIVENWIFQNSWTDRKEVKRFKSEKSLNKYLLKTYPDFNFYQ